MFQFVSSCFSMYQIVTIYGDKDTIITLYNSHSDKIESNILYMD